MDSFMNPEGANLHPASGQSSVVHNASDAAEMVAVGMRNDHRHYRSLAEFLVHELECGTRGFFDRQWVNNDPTGIALDEGDVGEVEAAHLVDARYNFKQTIFHVEQGLALQRRMDAVVVLPVQKEVPFIYIPGDFTLVVHDLAEGWGSDKSALGFLEVLLVSKGQNTPLLLLRLDCELRRRLSLRIEMLRLLRD